MTKLSRLANFAVTSRQYDAAFRAIAATPEAKALVQEHMKRETTPAIDLRCRNDHPTGIRVRLLLSDEYGVDVRFSSADHGKVELLTVEKYMRGGRAGVTCGRCGASHKIAVARVLQRALLALAKNAARDGRKFFRLT